jgi:hypothetical protein
MTPQHTAILTIHGAGAMSKRDRNYLALWLERQAASLRKDGHNYAPVYTARYLKRTTPCPMSPST